MQFNVSVTIFLTYLCELPFFSSSFLQETVCYMAKTFCGISALCYMQEIILVVLLLVSLVKKSIFSLTLF